MRKTKIVFDTSFLLEAAQNLQDAFEEAERLADEAAELVLPQPVFSELKSISAGKGRQARAAKMSLQLVEAKKGKTVVEKTVARKADDSVREICLKNLEKSERTIVCSNDYDLRKSLKKKANFLCVKKGRIGWC